jgi:hypothetical protein
MSQKKIQMNIIKKLFTLLEKKRVDLSLLKSCNYRSKYFIINKLLSDFCIENDTYVTDATRIIFEILENSDITKLQLSKNHNQLIIELMRPNSTVSNSLREKLLDSITVDPLLFVTALEMSTSQSIQVIDYILNRDILTDSELNNLFDFNAILINKIDNNKYNYLNSYILDNYTEDITIDYNDLLRSAALSLNIDMVKRLLVSPNIEVSLDNNELILDVLSVYSNPIEIKKTIDMLQSHKSYNNIGLEYTLENILITDTDLDIINICLDYAIGDISKITEEAYYNLFELISKNDGEETHIVVLDKLIDSKQINIEDFYNASVYYGLDINIGVDRTLLSYSSFFEKFMNDDSQDHDDYTSVIKSIFIDLEAKVKIALNSGDKSPISYSNISNYKIYKEILDRSLLFKDRNLI